MGRRPAGHTHLVQGDLDHSFMIDGAGCSRAEQNAHLGRSLTLIPLRLWKNRIESSERQWRSIGRCGEKMRRRRGDSLVGAHVRWAYAARTPVKATRFITISSCTREGGSRVSPSAVQRRRADGHRVGDLHWLTYFIVAPCVGGNRASVWGVATGGQQGRSTWGWPERRRSARLVTASGGGLIFPCRQEDPMVSSRVRVWDWGFCINMLESFLGPWIQASFVVVVLDLWISFELGF
jgi:hypothetical protein